LNGPAIAENLLKRRLKRCLGARESQDREYFNGLSNSLTKPTKSSIQTAIHMLGVMWISIQICWIGLPERHLETLMSAYPAGSGVKTLPRLLGQVVTVHETSFGFIGQITTLTGAHFDTNGDVFVHQDECSAPLATGLAIEFTLIDDPRRKGKFRAVNACTIVSLPVLAGETAQLPVLASPQVYHQRAKPIDPVEVRKAFANAPFGGIIGAEIGETVELRTDTDVSLLIATFLDEVFPGLQGQGGSHVNWWG